jgi:hypothetical protein
MVKVTRFSSCSLLLSHRDSRNVSGSLGNDFFQKMDLFRAISDHVRSHRVSYHHSLSLLFGKGESTELIFYDLSSAVKQSNQPTNINSGCVKQYHMTNLDALAKLPPLPH